MPFAPRVYRITPTRGATFFESDLTKLADHFAAGSEVEKLLRADVDALADRPAEKALAEVAWTRTPKTPAEVRARTPAQALKGT